METYLLREKNPIVHLAKENFQLKTHQILHLSAPMKKHRHGPPLIVLSIVFLGLIAFLSCILAEIKRTKNKDIVMAGKLCSAPASEESVRYGIAALICLSLAQIIGNVSICRNSCCCSKKNRNSSGDRIVWTISIMFLVISWIAFGLAVLLISAATSMNMKQPYGRGWLDGECYAVKNGVFPASAVLVLFTNGFMVASTIAARSKSQNETNG